MRMPHSVMWQNKQFFHLFGLRKVPQNLNIYPRGKTSLISCLKCSVFHPYRIDNL